MDSNLVIGLVVSALVVLVGLFISLATPLIKLNKTIQKLNDSIDRLEDNAKVRDIQLQKLHNEIDKHDKYLLIDKKRIDNHEERLNKLDNQIGIIDKEIR